MAISRRPFIESINEVLAKYNFPSLNKHLAEGESAHVFELDADRVARLTHQTFEGKNAEFYRGVRAREIQIANIISRLNVGPNLLFPVSPQEIKDSVISRVEEDNTCRTWNIQVMERLYSSVAQLLTIESFDESMTIALVEQVMEQIHVLAVNGVLCTDIHLGNVLLSKDRSRFRLSDFDRCYQPSILPTPELTEYLMHLVFACALLRNIDRLDSNIVNQVVQALLITDMIVFLQMEFILTEEELLSNSDKHNGLASASYHFISLLKQYNLQGPRRKLFRQIFAPGIKVDGKILQIISVIKYHWEANQRLLNQEEIMNLLIQDRLP